MTNPWAIEDLFEIRNRVWGYAPDPLDLLDGKVDGPTREEAVQMVAQDVRREVAAGEWVPDSIREWAEHASTDQHP